VDGGTKTGRVGRNVAGIGVLHKLGGATKCGMGAGAKLAEPFRGGREVAEPESGGREVAEPESG